MKTRISVGTLKNDRLEINEVDQVDFHEIASDDPIAFYFGQADKKRGAKLPKKSSAEYKELAPEYIRGYKTA